MFDLKSFSNVKIGSESSGVCSLTRDSFIQTRSGHLTVKIKRPDGGEVFLHSRFDPIKESRNQLESFEFEPLDTIIVFGSGLGYGVLELSDRLGPGNHLIVVERHPDLFLEACKNRKFQKILKRPRTFFFCRC